MLNNLGYEHTLKISNTHCCATATMECYVQTYISSLVKFVILTVTISIWITFESYYLNTQHSRRPQQEACQVQVPVITAHPGPTSSPQWGLLQESRELHVIRSSVHVSSCAQFRLTQRPTRKPFLSVARKTGVKQNPSHGLCNCKW